MKVFALHASRAYGAAVATALGVPLAAHEEREFEDGEFKVRALESVVGERVFVVQSLYGDAALSTNDKFTRLLFFIGSLKDAGAADVTAVVPYLAYMRKDRRTKPRDPITTRYVAAIFEAVGLDAIVTLDVHNVAAFENAFRCRKEHIEAAESSVKKALELARPFRQARPSRQVDRRALARRGRRQARACIRGFAFRHDAQAERARVHGEATQ